MEEENISNSAPKNNTMSEISSIETASNIKSMSEISSMEAASDNNTMTGTSTILAAFNNMRMSELSSWEVASDNNTMSGTSSILADFNYNTMSEADSFAAAFNYNTMDEASSIEAASNDYTMSERSSNTSTTSETSSIEVTSARTLMKQEYKEYYFEPICDPADDNKLARIWNQTKRSNENKQERSNYLDKIERERQTQRVKKEAKKHMWSRTLNELQKIGLRKTAFSSKPNRCVECEEELEHEQEQEWKPKLADEVCADYVFNRKKKAEECNCDDTSSSSSFQ